MSLKRPPSYGPRITILSVLLAIILGVGVNADAIFGPVPEAPVAEGSESNDPLIADGTDLDMETHVAEIMLGKATETLLSEATDGLPVLAEDWSVESLPRAQTDEGYVEDEDEEEYYDELDPLNTVMKVSSAKERAALAKLFEKKRTPNETRRQAQAEAPKPTTKATKSKPLAMRPNAAVITKKKPQSPKAKGAQRAKVTTAKKATSTAQKPAEKAAEPTKEVATEEVATEEAAKEEEAPKGPTIDPNASAKDLIAQGRKLLLSGNPSTAEKAYKMALSKQPSSARARYGLAKSLYQRNKAPEAIGQLRKILSANKNHGSALLMMGSLLQEQGQASQAKSYYQRYLDARPNGRRADEVRSILGRL